MNWRISDDRERLYRTYAWSERCEFPETTPESFRVYDNAMSTSGDPGYLPYTPKTVDTEEFIMAIFRAHILRTWLASGSS